MYESNPYEDMLYNIELSFPNHAETIEKNITWESPEEKRYLEEIIRIANQKSRKPENLKEWMTDPTIKGQLIERIKAFEMALLGLFDLECSRQEIRHQAIDIMIECLTANRRSIAWIETEDRPMGTEEHVGLVEAARSRLAEVLGLLDSLEGVEPILLDKIMEAVKWMDGTLKDYRSEMARTGHTDKHQVWRIRQTHHNLMLRRDALSLWAYIHWDDVPRNVRDNVRGILWAAEEAICGMELP